MPHETYRIFGRVIDRVTKNGVAQLRVEARDRELIFQDLVASAITDGQGAFNMRFERSWLDEIFLGRRHELVFKVFDGDKLLKTAEETVLCDGDHPDSEIIIDVDLAATGPAPFTVQGTISLAEGEVLAGVVVRAFDQDLRHEEPLGQTVTDAAGHYQITYTAEQFRRAEEGTADLIVRAFNAAGTLLAASPTLFNAPQSATIDLIVSADAAGLPSEYERIVLELEPLLAEISIEGIPDPELIDKLADLKADDIDFLMGETGIERLRLEFLADAARLEKQTHEEDLELPATVFYGLAREGLPLDLSALAGRGPRALPDALNQAFADNIIPATLKGEVNKLLADLQQLIAAHTLKIPPVEGGHSLGDLLGLAVPSPAKQASLIALYNSHDGPIEEFWLKLRQQPDFQTPGLVSSIQRNLQLGVLTQNHVPLIDALQRTHPLNSPRDLAKLDREDWKALINTSVNGQPIGIPPGVPGGTMDEKVANYVNGIVGLVQAVFSTGTVARLIANSPDINLDASTRGNVARFFSNSPDFDFRTTRVDSYIADHGDTALAGIPENERVQTVAHVKRIHRLLQVSTGPEVMTALVNSRFNSAHAIAITPPATFIAEMKDALGSKQKALTVHNRAQRIYVAALHVYTQIHQALNDIQPRAVNASGDAIREVLLKQSPTLADLFGSLELCDCLDCRSVLSPAAYFVDLLHLLENSIPNQRLQSPFDVLLERRPDLEYIKLNCENTNTFIPYVDLVNEVLESYIVYGQTLPFIRTHVPPPQHPLTIIMPNDSSDDVTADELAANPENTNAAAYDTLKGAVFPLTLPYNLPLHVARVYLEHLRSSRYEVMKAFQASGAPTDVDIACEYLGLSPEQRDILTGASPKTLRDFYGYNPGDHSPTNQPLLIPDSTGPDVIALQHLLNSADAKPILTIDGNFGSNTQAALHAFQNSNGLPQGSVDRATWQALDGVEEIWLAYLAQIPELLSHTGITYLELIELVKTWFINPNRPLIDFLESLKISYKDLSEWVAGGYTNPSPSLEDALKKAYPGTPLDEALAILRVWATNNFEKLNKVLVLYAPQDSQCDLGVTGIVCVDGTDADTEPNIVIGAVPTGAADKAVTWRKVHRFLRLWRTLGWSMSDLDKTFKGLGAGDITDATLQELAQLKQLQSDLNIPLIQLLSIWANIDSWGDASLYKKLFLNKSVLQLDQVFEPTPDGFLLPDDPAAPRISDHIPALLAAFRISAADLDAIRADAGLADHPEATPPTQAALTLHNVSVLYRYAVLGRALKLRAWDLIALKALSGIDPFTTPDQTIHFTDVAGKVKQSAFTIVQLGYLYRHLTAPSAGLPPLATALHSLAKTLRDGLTQISKDNVFAPDLDGQLTRTKLGLLLDGAVVDQVIGMVNGSAVYSAPLATLPPALAKTDTSGKVIGLDPAKLPPPVARKASYDATAAVLRFRGAMTDVEKAALRGAASDGPFQNAVENLYQQPLTIIEGALRGFLSDIVDAEKKLLRETSSLDQDLKPVLLDGEDPPRPTTDPAKAVTTAIAYKFAYLLTRLLPVLIDRLSHAFVKQTIADLLQLDGKVAELLLETQLKSPAAPTHAAVADLVALATPGLTAVYTNAAGASTERADAAVAFDGKGNTPETTIPHGTTSASWNGMLLGPNNSDFTFSIRTDGTPEFWVEGNTQALVPPSAPGTGDWVIQTAVPLKAGELYDIRLQITQLPATNPIAELRWQSATISIAIIPSDNLYPRAPLDNFTAMYTRVQKAALLVNAFKLDDKEIAYLSSNSADFGGFDLNALPLKRDLAVPPAVDVNAPALFKTWRRVNDYVTLRNSFPHGEVGTIDVFGAASLHDAQAKLAQATGWDAQIIGSLVDVLKLTGSDFKNEIELRRLQTCVRLIKRVGISAEKLSAWTTQPTDPVKARDQARDIKNIVKAKYDDETWATVAKPLSDKLREGQRAALVTYVLAEPVIRGANVKTADQLFEYFLIDVNMSPCTLTSRIKQAISSVQLFVDRCLMNLEADVRADAIDPILWQWMKHYRIWEANRKVFLYPENWIEPELRDDKSPFFKELESELLQNDLTTDTAEAAFLHYLEKLDEVARLEICGMYWQDNSAEFPTLSREATGPDLQRLLNEAGANPPIVVSGIFHRTTYDAVLAFQTNNHLTANGVVGPETWVALDPSKTVDVLHVFGRTLHIRHVYYYRKLINNATWTSWEKVPVDIEGDHLMPVIWNRRLYIFWLIFTQKAAKAGPQFMLLPIGKGGDGGGGNGDGPGGGPRGGGHGPVIGPPPGTRDSNTPPPQYWEIKLAWSEYENHKWSAKVISEESIGTSPPSLDLPNKNTFTAKALASSEGLLIRLYSTWSDTTGRHIGAFHLTGCHGRILPINPIRIFFFQWIEPIAYLTAPADSAVDFMTFKQNDFSRSKLLTLFTGDFGDDWAGFVASSATKTPIIALQATPSIFRILYPHQYYQYVLQAPFFYQDDRRTYFATTAPAEETVCLPVNANFARPDRNLLAHVPFANTPPFDIGAMPPRLGQGTAAPKVATGLPTSIAMTAPSTALTAAEPSSSLAAASLLTASAQAIGQPQPSMMDWSMQGVASRLYWPLPSEWRWVTRKTYDLKFTTHFHPYVCEFIKSLNKDGIPGLLTMASQMQSEPISTFANNYQPNPQRVELPYPVEAVDLGPEGKSAYSLYNWELFFHTVILIATRLSQNQRFDEARTWFHYIFDPTDNGRAGLLAAYYNSVDLGGSPTFRFDPDINFTWGGGPPLPNISPTNFSVRWTGKLIPQFTGAYTFHTVTDDGVRLWVNNQLLIDGWWDQAPTELTAISKDLTAGVPCEIKMEYYQRYGGSIAQLLWEGPNTPRAVIPPSQFFSVFYWKFLPFMATEKERIWDLLTLLSTRDDQLSPALKEKKKAFEDQIKEWQQHPFQPHLIARSRLIAYQKNVVMKYIDNLIAWGDQLFRQETIESINEATQLYVLAANILGPRPQRIPERGKVEPRTYADLRFSLDAFSNALVTIENEFPFSTGLTAAAGNDSQQGSGALGLGSTLYFCTPRNDKLLGYWDTVADRLFKIRNCMDIEGVVRQLPLFEPPIDPAILVRAAAAGVDLNSVLNDINTPVPLYRFNVMLQKAVDLTAEVKSLGAAFLAALEKKDAEALALLRSGHEIQVLTAVRQVKEKQIDEANDTLEGLNKYHDVVLARQTYYQGRLKLPINPKEQAQLDNMTDTWHLQTVQSTHEFAAGILHLIPDNKLGSPATIGFTLGGGNFGAAVQSFGAGMGIVSSVLSTQGAMSGISGGYDRRTEEWTYQLDLATKELDQVQKQIDAAAIRKDIASQELQNHDLQIANANDVDAFMRDKFTNQELYSWMTSQVSAIYFQSHQLAYEIAKKAEKAYRFELGLTDSNFIQFGYWDSLKKGLVSGEKLHYDLKRMEIAYLDKNKREYEITKQISLLLHDPFALIALKETGRCEVALPEALFDADYPGHYMRRIKNVSLTIPCVIGPYESVNCALRLLRHDIRLSSSPAPQYGPVDDEDKRFLVSFGSTQAIATSGAQNDSGLFEVNFRDERYLPFEAAGAVSTWRLELTSPFPKFDYETISDVIIHLRYTARDGGERLRDAAVGALQEFAKNFSDGREPLFRLLSLRHEFPSEWYKLLSPVSQSDPDLITRSADLVLGKDRYPFYLLPATVQPQTVYAIAVPQAGATLDPFDPLTLSLTAGKGSGNAIDFDLSLKKANNPAFGSSVLFAKSTDQISLPTVETDPGKAVWSVKVSLRKEAFGALGDGLSDLLLVVGYIASLPS